MKVFRRQQSRAEGASLTHTGQLHVPEARLGAGWVQAGPEAEGRLVSKQVAGSLGASPVTLEPAASLCGAVIWGAISYTLF